VAELAGIRTHVLLGLFFQSLHVEGPLAAARQGQKPQPRQEKSRQTVTVHAALPGVRGNRIWPRDKIVGIAVSGTPVLLWFGKLIYIYKEDSKRQYFFPKKLNWNYAAVLATAVKNWFWNLPSGEDIPKKFPFLWPNGLIERKIAQVSSNRILFVDFEDTTPLVSRFLRGDGLKSSSQHRPVIMR
jgi:hypothetical protein